VPAVVFGFVDMQIVMCVHMEKISGFHTSGSGFVGGMAVLVSETSFAV
jgi:hypothetical protein